mmetsp:Transcript_34083/g.109378  ORF Transcript_34083/g.109378 Transcript_34083/m.109378 type:complete len:290 (-) Transcript_34083:3466-4335(-)
MSATVADVKKQGVAMCMKLPDELQSLTVVGCEHVVPLLWLAAAHEGQRLTKKAKAYFDKDSDGRIDQDTLLGKVWRSWKLRSALWFVIMAVALIYVDLRTSAKQKLTVRFVRLLGRNVDLVVLVLGSIFDAPRSLQLPLQSAAYVFKDRAHDFAKATPASNWVLVFVATAKVFKLLPKQLDDVFNADTATSVFGNLFGYGASQVAAAKKKKDDDADADGPGPDDETKAEKIKQPTESPTTIPVWASLALFGVWFALGAGLDAKLRDSIMTTLKAALTQGVDAFVVDKAI